MNDLATITIIRGTSQTFTLTFTDNNGNPINLTGYKIYFTVKTPFQAQNGNDSLDADCIVQILATLTTPLSGIATVAISAAQTLIDYGNYLYDIRAISGSNVVSSIPSADFIVNPPVTNRQS